MEFINGMVSIIIPVYNAKCYLEDILFDLIKQTYNSTEIIIINDGSTDESENIIREFAKKDTRVRYINTENDGPSKARNLGLDMAKGEYVRFIDADDRIPNDSLKNMVRVFEESSDIDLVIGNYVIDSKNEYFTGSELPEGVVSAKDFSEIFVNNMRTFYFGVPWNKLYKRDIIEKNQIRFNEDIIWCEDFLFNVTYYSKCENLYVVNQPQGVYQYYTRETGITSQVSKQNMDEIQRVNVLRYNAMKEYCVKYGLQDIFELEWKYADFYSRLSTMTRYFRNETIIEKYSKFKQYLSEDDVYRYICMKWSKEKYTVWRLLKEACETKKYMRIFLFFIIKEFQQKYTGDFFYKEEKDLLKKL